MGKGIWESFTFFMEFDVIAIPMDLKALLKLSRKAVETSTQEILVSYKKPFKKYKKPDDTWVTDLDFLSDEILSEILSTSGIPILSEENLPKDNGYLKWPAYWCLDPIDGTSELIEGSNEWTMNLALVSNKEVVLSVLGCPTLKKIYFATKGLGAYVDAKGKVSKLPRKKNSKVLLTSRRESLPPWKKALKTTDYTLESLSSAIKFAKVAEGEAVGYFRTTPSYEWDTAAGDLLVTEAGYVLTQFDSKKGLAYQKKDFEQPGYLVATPENYSELKKICVSTQKLL